VFRDLEQVKNAKESRLARQFRIWKPLSPHSRNEVVAVSLRVLSFISIYAVLNAVKTVEFHFGELFPEWALWSQT
jgi:hypothetical protein